MAPESPRSATKPGKVLLNWVGVNRSDFGVARDRAEPIEPSLEFDVGGAPGRAALAGDAEPPPSGES